MTVPQGATVYDAFAAALNQAGLDFAENRTGYIEGIRAPSVLGGYWLREFDNGPHSGWKYLVNGSYPGVGLRYCWLKDGDSIIWRYVDDYTDPVDDANKWQEAADIDPADPSGPQPVGDAAAVVDLINAIGTVTKDSGSKIAAARSAYNQLSSDQKKLVSNYALLTQAELAYARLTGQVPFVDVPAGAWYREAVQYVYGEELFNGTSDTVFSPNRNMNRAMVATVLYRLAGKPEASGTSLFEDVAANAWYTDAVLWASGSGIVNGYGSNRFGGSDPVTREQLAAMLYRYAKFMQYDVSSSGKLSAYTDASRVSDWALEAMQWANAAGLITGRSSASLAPQGTATRAEVAIILMRFAELAK